MADTYTTALAIRQPQTGAYNNAWGSVLNADMMQLFDDAITGQSEFSVASTAISLAGMTQGATSTSRMFCMQFTNGSPSGAVTATLPSTVGPKFYLIDNQCGQPITFTYGPSISTASTVTVATGSKALIWADGTNVWSPLASALSATQLNGVPYNYWARVAQTPAEVSASTVVQNVFTGVTNLNPYAVVTEAPTTTINCQAGNLQQLTLTGNRTMAIPANPGDGFELDLLVIQDSTGGRTLTWNSIFQFAGGLTPTLSSTAGGIDRFLMVYNASLNKWLCGQFGAVNAASGATTNVTITAGGTYFNLLAALGAVSVATTVNVTVNKGVIIQSVTPGTPAMDLSGLPSGSTVNLFNNGYILGCGGNGADGAFASYPGSGASVISAPPGGNGGNAIVGPGASRTFNITNANGNIWGGGGGGGGGGAYDGVSSGNGSASSGGGGGGAGGGRGGKGGLAVYISGGSSIAVAGAFGTAGPLGTGGAAGSSTSSGTGSAGNAGAGGNYGANGSTGTAPGTVVTGHTAAFSAGGTAGKAIELLGAGAPTFLSGSGSPNVLGAVS